MIRFTSGTLFKVISLCKSGRRYSDDTIASMLFPNVKYTTNYIGHVKNCTKNLPDEVTQYMSNSNREEIIKTLMSSVSDVFTTVISTEKQTLLIAAIQTILDSDKSIQDSVQIGYLPTYTKGRMKNATTVDPIEFIANALFCVCNQQNNTDGKADIKKINDDFIKSLQSKAASITLQTIISTQEEAMSSVMPAVIGDDYSILYEEPKQSKTVDIYKKFSHSWKIKNTGIVPWHGRYITLQNSDSVRIKPIQDLFLIPDLEPNSSAVITVEMDSRYFEGTYNLVWQIKLSDGTICFPNKSDDFSFKVTVKSNI